MIFPEPESDLSQNVIILSAEVIQILKKVIKKKKYAVLDDLIDPFLSNDRRKSINLLLDCLTFLFFTNIIEIGNYKIFLKDNSPKQTTIDKFFKK